MISAELRLYLGIIGLLCMISLCFYSLRKRLSSWQKWGELKIWLNGHIALGLISVPLILIHSNFQAHGVAMYPYYSMWVVVFSGVVGKFLMKKVAISRTHLAIEMWHKQQTLTKEIREFSLMGKWQKGVLVHEVGGDLVITCPWDQDVWQFFVYTKTGEFFLRRKFASLMAGWEQNHTQSWEQFTRLGRSLGQFDFYRRVFSFWVPLHVTFSFVLFLFVVVHVGSSLYFLVHW